jgi:hypothetical protein
MSAEADARRARSREGGTRRFGMDTEGDTLHRCRHGVCLDECCADYSDGYPCGYCLDEAAE